MKEISSYSDLLFQDDSIWFSQKNETKIHYPEQGNSIFSQIEEKSFWYIHRNNVIVEIIKKHINPKSIFFEIGGGNGYVLSKIKDEGFDCVMLEPDLNGILIAQKRGINNLICSNFYDACFKNNTIPNIGIFDVLEHIEDENMFLNSLFNSLEINGKLIITVPAYNFLWSDEDNHDGHFRRYNIKNISEVLIKHGFKIDYKSYFFSVLPIPIFILRTIPTFLKIKRKYSVETYQKENTIDNTFLMSLLKKIWEWEILFLKKDKKIRFGGSILIVASKS